MKRLLQITLLLAGLAWCVPAWAGLCSNTSLTGGWNCHNAQSGQNSGTSTSIAATAFTNALVNPSFIVAALGQTGTTQTFTVTDTAGNTYTDCGSGSVNWQSSGSKAQLFCAPNTSTTASNIVTAHSTVTGTFFTVTATEYTGNATSSAIDTFAKSTANATTSGTAADNQFTANATTTVNGDLVFAFSEQANGTISAGTGFTSRPTTGNFTEDLVQAASSATTKGSMSNNTSAIAYAVLMVAIKPPAASTFRTQVGGFLVGP